VKRPRTEKAIELAELLSVLAEHPRVASCTVGDMVITMRDEVFPVAGPENVGGLTAEMDGLDLPADAPDPRELIKAVYERKMGRQARSGKVPR
jgi:hypothetical protein